MCTFEQKFGRLPTHMICDWNPDCEGCIYNSETEEETEDGDE